MKDLKDKGINSHVLRELLQKKQVTNTLLAEEINVSRQTVSNWLSGRSFPDTQTLQKIFIALDLTEEEKLELITL